MRNWLRRVRRLVSRKDLSAVRPIKLHLTAEQRQSLDLLLNRLDFRVAGSDVLEVVKGALRPADAAALIAILNCLGERSGHPPVQASPSEMVVSLRDEAGPRRRNILFITGEFPSQLHGGGIRVSDFIRLIGGEHNVYLYSACYQGSTRSDREAL